MWKCFCRKHWQGKGAILSVTHPGISVVLTSLAVTFFVYHLSVPLCVMDWTWNVSHRLIYWGLGYQMMGFGEVVGSRGYYWEVVKVGGGVYLEGVSHWEHVLKRCILSLVSSLSVFPVSQEVNGLCHMFLLLGYPAFPQTQSNGSSQAWTKTYETRRQDKSFLILSLFSQVFVTSKQVILALSSVPRIMNGT